VRKEKWEQEEAERAEKILLYILWPFLLRFINPERVAKP
jgi:hypothetical protein